MGVIISFCLFLVRCMFSASFQTKSLIFLITIPPKIYLFFKIQNYLIMVLTIHHQVLLPVLHYLLPYLK
jgi:hypothetical protein